MLTTASATLLAVGCGAGEPLPRCVPLPHDSEGKLVLVLDEPPTRDALVGVDDGVDELDDEHAARPSNRSTVPVTPTRVGRAARKKTLPNRVVGAHI
jgi:hypothetical protein